MVCLFLLLTVEKVMKKLLLAYLKLHLYKSISAEAWCFKYACFTLLEKKATSWQIRLLNRKLRIKCSLDGVKVYLQKAKRHLWFSNPTEFNITYTHVTPMDCWDMWKTKMEADKQDSRSPFCRSRKTWKQKADISENIYLIKELESEFIHILIAILLHMKISMLKDTMDMCTII